MNGTIIFVILAVNVHSLNINMLSVLLNYLALDSVWLEYFSYWGSGRRYCECQARTRGGEVVLFL